MNIVYAKNKQTVTVTVIKLTKKNLIVVILKGIDCQRQDKL